MLSEGDATGCLGFATGCLGFGLAVVFTIVSLGIASAVAEWSWLAAIAVFILMVVPVSVLANEATDRARARDRDAPEQEPGFLPPIVVNAGKAWSEDEIRWEPPTMAPRATRLSPSAKFDRLQQTPTERIAFQELMNRHRAMLLVRRARLIADDGYGNEDRTKWEQELRYFIDNVLRKDGRLSRWLSTWRSSGLNLQVELINGEEGAFLAGHLPQQPAVTVEQALDNRHHSVVVGQASRDARVVAVEQELDNGHHDAVLGQVLREVHNVAGEEALDEGHYRRHDATPDTSGAAFEAACAATLDAAGWRCAVVGTSGDQGVDIVARRGHTAVAIQCKDWSRPVGNSAVQEVYAGMMVYDCTAGVVVARNGFTKSAVELADKTGVLLVNPGQLATLATLIGIG